MPQPQFTLRALLVAMLVVAAFLGGMAVQRRIDVVHPPYTCPTCGTAVIGLDL